MAYIVEFGDFVQGELITFLPKEKDGYGNELQPMVVSVHPEVLRLFDIDLTEFGVDKNGSSTKGGMYYKAVTYPAFITEPTPMGDTIVIRVLTGIKFQGTPLSDMFSNIALQNERLRDAVNGLKAEISWYKIELNKMKLSRFSLLQDYADAKSKISGNVSPGDEDEVIKGASDDS